MATELQGFQHPIPGQWNREGTRPAVSPWVLWGSPVGPCFSPAERGKLPADTRLAVPLWLTGDQILRGLVSLEQSGPQPWARGQALRVEHGVPSCSSPPFVGTAYPHHPSGINCGQEQREGKQAAPVPIPALLLHQPLPPCRLKSLSGHCMAARGNTAHQTTLRLVSCQSPSCDTQPLLTDERLETSRVFHHSRNVGWSSAIG